jgi:hypothetical protein
VVFFAVVFVIEATPRDVFVRASMMKPTRPPRDSPITKPNSAKKPNVGQKPTEGLIGAAPVTKADAMTPTTAPVIMNDHMRGARRMVTSSVAMSLFSQGGKGDEFREGRPRSRCSNGPATDGLIPRFVPNREGHESRRIQFDDVGRGASSVTQPLDDLDGAVGWDAHLDRLAGGDAGKLLQDESHRSRRQFAVSRTAPDRGNRSATAIGIDSAERHGFNANDE